MAISPETQQRPRRRYPQKVRRELMLDVAERLFIEHGYAAVTMEDIARDSGVTRPVVYNHFETREGVYIACVKRARDQYDAELLGSLDVNAPPKELLASGGDLFFRMLERDRGRWLLLFGSNSVLPATHGAELSALRFRTIEQITGLLRSAYPQAPRQRIEACAHAVSGVGERLGHWWMQNPKMRRRDIVEHFTEILWAGLQPFADADDPYAEPAQSRRRKN